MTDSKQKYLNLINRGIAFHELKGTIDLQHRYHQMKDMLLSNTWRIGPEISEDEEVALLEEWWNYFKSSIIACRINYENGTYCFVGI